MPAEAKLPNEAMFILVVAGYLPLPEKKIRRKRCFGSPQDL
jgi:hypothetical protein